MSDAFTAKRQQLSRQSHSACSTTAWCLKLALTVMFFGWSLVIVRHVSGRAPLRAADSVSGGSRAASNRSKTALRIKVNDPNPLRSVPFEETDESYHLVFSTGCSEFQDWQSIGVYSSAQAVGQRGIITRIASGCSESQQAALRHAMAHLPKRCRIHFAPSTDVKDHAGHFYKYANKPLGLMHWLIHADPKISPHASVALLDPDFFFLKPLWHDSFESPSQYFATGDAQRTPMPVDPISKKVRVIKGSMVAQRYGIGGKPWTLSPGRNGQKTWALKEFFEGIGRPSSPALAADLIGDENNAGEFYSIGAPYIALASDWLPISTNWTRLMYMAVERNFGNLAEMYAMVVAVADYGIRPVMIDSLMVSNVDAGGEGWPLIERLPLDRGCDPNLLHEDVPLPTFMHYCQGYKHPGIIPNPGFLFSKYSVPDAILECAAEQGGAVKTGKGGKMVLDSNGLLPEPDVNSVAKNKRELRSIFAHCFSTRGTNQAVRDYRSWFCDKKL